MAHERIAAVTGELDDTFRKLRDTIYSLRTAGVEQEPLTGRILRVVRESSRSYVLSPKVSLDGPVDAVSDDVAVQLLPVLSEALSNALRHSGAREIQVSLTVDAGELQLTVTDDGNGFSEPAKVSGLANMRHRARLLGGLCGITRVPGAGTTVTWSALVS